MVSGLRARDEGGGNVENPLMYRDTFRIWSFQNIQSGDAPHAFLMW